MRFSLVIEACFVPVGTGSPFAFLVGFDGSFFEAVGEGRERGSAVHTTALMGSFCVVGDEPVIEHLLHLVYGLEPSLSALYAEVLVEHGAVEPLDDAVRLRTAHFGGAVFGLFELEEEFVRMIGPKEPCSTVLNTEHEAIIVAFRCHTLLPLDDCLYALQPTIPHLTRSSLHRCLQHYGIAGFPMSKATSPQRRSSSAIRSAISISKLPKCKRPRASSICM